MQLASLLVFMSLPAMTAATFSSNQGVLTVGYSIQVYFGTWLDTSALCYHSDFCINVCHRLHMPGNFVVREAAPHNPASTFAAAD